MESLTNIKVFKIFLIALLTIFSTFCANANERSKLPPVPAGIYSVGPGGTYTSTISAAITSINAAGGISGPIVLELNAAYNASSEILNPITGASTTNTITIRPAAGVTKIISSSALNGPTISILGGKFYIIDGQSGGTGGAKNLTITNTNAGGSACVIRFQNDGSNNVVKFCAFRGQNTTSTNGVVLFGTTTGSTGNDNNLITDCDITSVSNIALSSNGVYSAGTVSKSNDLNTISNCNIYDVFNSTAKSVGILMGANTSSWTITGNSFYQTTSRSSANTWSAIELNNTATGGNGFNIANNFIGGTAPLAASGVMTFTYTGSGYFSGINIYGFSGAANVVSGNTIKNLSITCNQLVTNYCISNLMVLQTFLTIQLAI